jgi:hypothetical protein
MGGSSVYTYCISYGKGPLPRLRVFKNRVLRRIFGPKRDEVRAKWRILLNEELHDLYTSPIIMGMIKSR